MKTQIRMRSVESSPIIVQKKEENGSLLSKNILRVCQEQERGRSPATFEEQSQQILKNHSLVFQGKDKILKDIKIQNIFKSLSRSHKTGIQAWYFIDHDQKLIGPFSAAKMDIFLSKNSLDFDSLLILDKAFMNETIKLRTMIEKIFGKFVVVSKKSLLHEKIPSSLINRNSDRSKCELSLNKGRISRDAQKNNDGVIGDYVIDGLAFLGEATVFGEFELNLSPAPRIRR
jgi:hypothetical protein